MSDVVCAEPSGIRARVKVTGEHAELVETMWTELLGCLGFEVARRPRLELRVTVKLEDAGQGHGATARLHFANGIMIVKAVDTKTKSFLFAETIDTHYGHRTLEQASAGTLRRLCEKTADRVAPELRKAPESLR